MILRDKHGEIETGIGDLFCAKIGASAACIFSIVCHDTEASAKFGKPIICVRLYGGVFDYDGQRWQVEEGKNPPLFIFTAELVADCLRTTRRHVPGLPQLAQCPPPSRDLQASMERITPSPGTQLSQPARQHVTRFTPKKSAVDQPTLWEPA